MAIPGDPMCGLHVVRKGHGHKIQDTRYKKLYFTSVTYNK